MLEKKRRKKECVRPKTQAGARAVSMGRKRGKHAAAGGGGGGGGRGGGGGLVRGVEDASTG